MDKGQLVEINYKKAGVDIEKAEGLVSWLKKSIFQKESFGSDFCSYFPFPTGNYKNPVLVSSADGVGTKVKLASYYEQWDTIGQDLVAMCVNDLICSGATPLFFLDYYSCGHLNVKQAKEFLKGVNKACEQARCSLLGGETAELPGLYKEGDFDCAGFAVGVVEKEDILGPHRVRSGDKIIALKGSGFHSNGYSLLRKLYHSKEDLQEQRKKLMEPTPLYTFLVSHFKEWKGLKAIAHITGGGLNNISRIIPEGLVAELKPWDVPEKFLKVKQKGEMSWESLFTTFNCGLGLVLVFSGETESFDFLKEGVVDLGEVRAHKNSSIAGERWLLDFSAL